MSLVANVASAPGCGRRTRALPRGAQPRGVEAAECGAQPHGMVRERRALHASGAAAIRVQLAHREPAHRPREPAAARSRDTSTRSRRSSRGAAALARPRPPMFLPLRLSSMRAREPCGGVADGAISARGRRARRLASWFTTASRAVGGAGLVVTEMTCTSAGCAHLAGLHRPVERGAARRAGGASSNSCTWNRRRRSPAARPRGPQGFDAARLAGDGSALAGGQLAARVRRRPCRTRRREPGAAGNDRRRTSARAADFVRAARCSAPRPDSTCSSCTWRTAICWRAFSRR